MPFNSSALSAGLGSMLQGIQQNAQQKLQLAQMERQQNIENANLQHQREMEKFALQNAVEHDGKTNEKLCFGLFSEVKKIWKRKRRHPYK